MSLYIKDSRNKTQTMEATMSPLIAYTEDGQIILPSKITTSSLVFKNNLTPAKPIDLKIDTFYYQLMQDGVLYIDQVRKKYRFETKKEYQEYKEFLIALCDNKRCYILHQNYMP
tara:strand:+ start:28 stop:369 length:342 start_codon:yes stop_codon:yes gene_type:complete